MAELGQRADSVLDSLAKAPETPAAWVDAYAADGGLGPARSARSAGWRRGSRSSMRSPTVRRSAVVRQLYEDACAAMAEGFADRSSRTSGTSPAVLSQTDVWPDEVEKQPKPVAYFLVDAMRFEMGQELAERLAGFE